MSEKTEVLSFTLKRQEQKITIDDKTFTVKEMTGQQRDEWMNSMSARMKTDANGKPVTLRDFTGLHASLIAKCLYDENGNLVTSDNLKDWPAGTQKGLFELCQKINGLGEEAEEEVKNG